MKVLHVIGYFHPSLRASGPGESVFRLCRALRDYTPIRPHVCALAAGLPPEVPIGEAYDNEGIPTWFFPMIRRYWLAPRQYSWIARHIRSYDLLHVHSYFLPVSEWAAWLADRAGLPVVWSPHGEFLPAAMRVEPWRKPFVLMLLKRWSRRFHYHATSEKEAEAIERILGRRPLAVIPNIAPISPRRMPLEEQMRRWRSGERLFLYVGRLHPIKNLESLLAAWRRMPPHCRLVLIGPEDDPGYRQRLEFLAAGLTNIVWLTETLPPPAVQQWMGRASALVLPSLSENFGNVVLEALIQGTPAVVSTGAPWQCLSVSGAGLWIRPTADNLCCAMRRLAEESEEQHRQRRIAAEQLSWRFSTPGLARAYASLYQSASEKRRIGDLTQIACQTICAKRADRSARE